MAGKNLTICATPKPMLRDFATIQRNAVASWGMLDPRPQIILYGNAPGVGKLCAEVRANHVPEVAISPQGTPLLNHLIEDAQERAASDLLCFINCDILLFPDFLMSVNVTAHALQRFLLVGRRTTLDVRREIDFRQEDWEIGLRECARRTAPDRPDAIDYFVFTPGVFGSIPPFAVGRPGYDNWLIWRARSRGAPVVDATDAVTAVHQRHDYSHLDKGRIEAFAGLEAQQNRQLTGGPTRIWSITQATHVISGNYRLTKSPVGHRLRGATYCWRLRLKGAKRKLSGEMALTKYAPRVSDLLARARHLMHLPPRSDRR